ncbi:MAG: AAA family ATPase [Clostridiales bacterium]|nr:AAA family ATPase [Clostridiales bacterium]
MGIYLNPGNRGFQTILNGTYVDKTGLIDFINRTINTPQKLMSFSRPRRFGKSFAAKMLCAYYDKCCDSRSLFEGLEISKKDSFEEYLNKYDAIYLDITWFITSQASVKNVVRRIQLEVISELREAYGDCVDKNETFLPDALAKVSIKTGNQFIFIIDEWDALFREAKNDIEIHKEYMNLLRALFKGGITTDVTIAATYMTGILPIKKYGTGSSLNNFQEFTALESYNLAEYVGFTENEVRHLCDIHQVSFEDMQALYDGYIFERVHHVYNPYTVMSAIEMEEFDYYWNLSGTYLSLMNYIGTDFDGLKETILKLLRGEGVKVNTRTFLNDFVSFHYKDDILTLLIHLGYLSYDAENKKAFIPNTEVKKVFEDAVRGLHWESD